jgi:hypothetical protein
MLLLFVKGDKGLLANKDGKIYFPDRKSSIKAEGLYDCAVTIDKNNYAFVSGTQVNTFKPDDSTVQNLTASKMLKNNFGYDIPSIDDFQLRKIGESLVMYIRYNSDILLSYFDSTSGRHDFMRISSFDWNDRKLRDIYWELKFEMAVNYSEINDKLLLANAKELLSEEDKMKAAVASVCTTHIPLSRIMTGGKTCEVYSNKILVVPNPPYVSDAGRFHSGSAYIIRKDTCDAVNVSHILNREDVATVLGKRTGSIKLEDMKTWMIENHVGQICYYTNKLVITNTSLYVMNDTLNVAFFNGEYIAEEIDVVSQKLVDDSWAEIEALRKKLAKNYSKAVLPELKKLLPVNILNLN